MCRFVSWSAPSILSPFASHNHPSPKQPPSLFASDWEKTFKVCKCEGLGGPDTPAPAVCHERTRNYGKELSDLLFAEARLCTGDWPCFEAYDDLADGTRVNLTHRVNVAADALTELPAAGEGEGGGSEQGAGAGAGAGAGRRGSRGASSIRRFVLPIEVADDAGNRASAELRFNVEEISLFSVIQPDKPPVRSPTMPKIPPPPTHRRSPAPAPVQDEGEEEEEEEKEEEVAMPTRAVKVEKAAAPADAERETRTASCTDGAPSSPSTKTTSKTTTTTTSSTTTGSRSSSSKGKDKAVEAASYDEDQGVAQLLFMLVVASLVATCIWGTRGTTPPEEVVLVADNGRDDPLDASPSSSFVYSESPNPVRSRQSAPTTQATPPFSSRHLS